MNEKDEVATPRADKKRKRKAAASGTVSHNVLVVFLGGSIWYSELGSLWVGVADSGLKLVENGRIRATSHIANLVLVLLN